MLTETVHTLINSLADTFDVPGFLVKGIVAVLLVSLLCGAVGSLVIGNRMAFFSDAMAHCAFAGVALGHLTILIAGGARDGATAGWFVPLVMVLFGAAVGVSIGYVRDRTSLANDTVIGVFFALAIGFGAMLFAVLQKVAAFDPEKFLFGSPLFVLESDLLYLVALLFVAAAFFAFRYNDLVFASFNPSLARSRQISLKLNNYLFIVLLALVVNLSIRAVGALLINALLVVPAATAANLARNLSQLFWMTVLCCVTAGLGGFWLSYVVEIPFGRGDVLKFGPSGTIVVFSVCLFFLSMAVRPIVQRRPT